MFTSSIVSLVFAASALANVFITNPVSSTSLPSGQQVSIMWQDDGNTPPLAQFGLADFGLYAGNAIEQTLLQTIATNVNVSLTNGVPFTPDASVGPNGDQYFIRVTSLSFKNPSASQYPMEAFSALFTLTGMTGQFNSTVQAEINGQSTAPIEMPTSSGSSGGNSPASPTSSHASSSSTKTSPTGSPATSSTANGAAKPVIATGFVALIAALVGASLF